MRGITGILCPKQLRVMGYRLTGCYIGVPGEQRECRRSKIKEITVENFSELKTWKLRFKVHTQCWTDKSKFTPKHVETIAHQRWRENVKATTKASWTPETLSRPVFILMTQGSHPVMPVGGFTSCHWTFARLGPGLTWASLSPLCPRESNSWLLPPLLHPDPQLPHDVTLCASVAFLVHKDVYLGLKMAIPVLNLSFSLPC